MIRPDLSFLFYVANGIGASIDLKTLEQDFGSWYLSEVPEKATRVGERGYDDRLDRMDINLEKRWKVYVKQNTQF